MSAPDTLAELQLEFYDRAGKAMADGESPDVVGAWLAAAYAVSEKRDS